MSAFLPGGGRMFTVQCSSCKRGQKGVFETGFHLTSKIFAAISLNIFFVCVSACVPECVCVTHICMAALVAALFAADGRKNNENTKQRQVESASPRFDFALASCVAYFKAPGRLRLLLVSLPLTYIIINHRLLRCCCCCLFDCCFN